MPAENGVTNETQKNELPERVHKKIKSVILENGFSEKATYKIDAGSQKGDNYVAEIYTLFIAEKGKTLSLILKFAPLDETKRESMKTLEIFRREIYFYLDVMPALVKFQETKNMKHKFDSTAKCYGCTEELILLENLMVDGYRMESRFVGLQLPALKILIRKLAQFHSISFAYRDQYPEKYQEIAKNIPELVFGEMMNKELFDLYEKQLITSSENCISDESYIPRFRRFSEKYFSTMKSLTEDDDDEPYECLNHGDCWINNFLFKYSEENPKKPVEAKFIDFQIIRNASPVLDLSYLIYCSTQKSLRDKYLLDILDLYFQTLHENIREHGSDPETLYPRREFDRQLKKNMKFGLGMAMMLLPLLNAEKDDIPEFTMETNEEALEKLNGQMAKLSSNEVVKQKLGDVIVEMIDRDFI